MVSSVVSPLRFSAAACLALPVALCLALSLALWRPGTAEAFCRSTTCKGEACGTDNDGCPASGAKLFWRTHCIGYSLQKLGTQNLPNDKVKLAVQGAFQAWSDIDCGNGQNASLTFGELKATNCISSEFNGSGPNVNVVIFRDDDWKFKNSDNTLAKAIAHFDAKTGEIYDADVEVNTASNHFTLTSDKAEFDLQTVLTHEVGHFIGLGHSQDFDAVMYASYERGSTKGRKLSADDIAAVCAMYPPGRPGTCDLNPKGGLDLCEAPVDSGCRAGHHPVSGHASPPGGPQTGWVPLVWAIGCTVIWRLRCKEFV